jgi:hypothetical protein
MNYLSGVDVASPDGAAVFGAAGVDDVALEVVAEVAGEALAGTAGVSGLGRYSGPRCPQADSTDKCKTTIMARREKAESFTIKMQYMGTYWSVA